MARDVLRKPLHHESVDQARTVVRNAFGEAIIELQQMAGGAALRKSDGRHVGACGPGSERVPSRCGRSGAPLRVAVGPRLVDGRDAMAVGTVELHRPARAAEDCLQVHSVIELDLARVAPAGLQRGKFRMMRRETLYFALEGGDAALRLQVRMALRAACLAHRGQPQRPSVLHMAGCAARREELVGMMDGAVVT